MAEYKNPLKIDRNEAAGTFFTGSNNEICDSLLSAALHEVDWKWVQTQCLLFLNHPDPDVSGLAATCLGHLARIHHKLDREIVVLALKNRLEKEANSGRIRDALDDIEMFL